jgi:hypothetical protein
MGYPISVDDIGSWSVASSASGIVKSIAEKQYPKAEYGDSIRGVIGCYYFKNFEIPKISLNYLSDVICEKIKVGQTVYISDCTKAEFFGDPKRLTNLYKEKNASTVFCDIDGTIVKHENIPDYSKPLELLEGAIQKIKEWRKDNCFIVLTTSRDEQFRPDMELLLRNAGIDYETLVMGLPPGARYLVNDKKPYSDKKMASAYEVTRNTGIKNLTLGNSVADLKFDENFIVKSIPKDVSDYQKNKFKAQYDSMFKIYKSEYSSCVPAIGDFDGQQYSMERLVGYCGLHLVDNKERYLTLQKVFETLNSLYKFKPSSEDWLNNYLDEKIYSKEKTIKNFGFSVECDEIFEILKTVTRTHFDSLKPKSMTDFFVGDLTYENILSNGQEFKLIDFDNDNKAGVAEMDLGKLLQSYLTKYEWWDEDTQSNYPKEEYDLIIRFYADLLNEPVRDIINKGNFYCALHLFRMVPYQAQRDIKRAKKALDFCKQLLNDCC